MSDLKEALRRRARALGFDLFGVTRATPPSTGEFFHEWLGAGYHGEMEYLARRERERADPQQLLPGARSIICVGMNYFAEEPETVPSGPAGRVARYAWGEDYHRVMGKKLKELAGFVRESADGGARAYVDTGPVLEREYAARAGIGWFGKNTNLIREGLGSWFLIGEILTDVELEADDPVPDRCGTCVRCIEACPTGAILEPYLLDSNACISYLTIEYRGVIPREHREPMGDWVFGCDICQDVCPWNRKAPETEEDAFRPRDGVPRAELIGLLEMTEDEWRNRFRQSAIKRAGWRGMRRNAAVALGNTNDRACVPALAATIGGDDPILRAHAAWALGRLGGEEAARALACALEREDDAMVREEIEAALGAEAAK
ncbi:MAG: tRNA epoxyqueuosine(34) reductase QueG [Planctomycetota bacterium]|nr:tRNA epoxyqueuosine(34) reductase QueG [Planctomycetota bacterium]